jgi:TetR/AcrR family transcriptional regulator
MPEPTTPQTESTEQRIFDAAREVFIQKGLDGAKMQDIADRAGINKALLHYYYRSKEKLYEMVAKAVLNHSAPLLRGIIESDLALEEKITAFVNQYIGIVSKNHYLPLFLISEMNKHPDRFFDDILPKDFPKPEKFIAQVQEAVAEGRIRPIDPRHLVVNTISMCVFPFIGKPMLRMAMGMSATEWQIFIEQRKKEVSEFLLAALRP